MSAGHLMTMVLAVFGVEIGARYIGRLPLSHFLLAVPSPQSSLPNATVMNEICATGSFFHTKVPGCSERPKGRLTAAGKRSSRPC